MSEFMLEPPGNYIAVEITEEREKVTAGGIFIPDQAKERPERGTVLAVRAGAVRPDWEQSFDAQQGRRHCRIRQVRAGNG